MSAIFGIIHWDGKHVDRRHLERMNAALACHGADGGGVWLDNAAGMGQRLMRFTPQDTCERQPLISADRSLVLVSDARIDNRAELMVDLAAGSPSHAMPIGADDLPDSALLLCAYERWGLECVGHLVGVFAFAIWDAKTRKLFAARSPIVAPTLMYHVTPLTFAFATAPSGLHSLPFIPRALNEERIANMLAQMGGLHPSSTLYDRISRLPTGFCLTADGDGVKTRCYWRPDLNHEIRFARDEEYVDAFHDLFTRVVGDHLRSATPVAVQMSGGLDSSSIAAMATRLLARRGERLTAFTEVPRPGFSGSVPHGKYADETPFVEAIAAMYKSLDLNLMRTDGLIFLDDLDSLFPYLEAPFSNTSNRVWIEAIIRESARQGKRVLLDGIQGNLTMSCNGSGLLPGLIHSGRWLQAYREARAGRQKGTTGATLRAMIGQGVMPLLPDFLWLAIERLRHPEIQKTARWDVYSPIHPDFAATQHIPERARHMRYVARFRPKADNRMVRYQALCNQDAGAYLSAYRAMYGVDSRTPPADVRLAEFCLALPEDQYRRAGESRSFMRRAMAQYLPEMVLTNRLRGLQAADWFERLTGARDKVAAELNRIEQSALAQRILDLKRMRRLFEEMPSFSIVDTGLYWDYQMVFQRGLMMGRFLCWFENGRG